MAPPSCPSGTTSCRASPTVAGIPRATKAAVTIALDSRSPYETTLSDVRGVSSPTAQMPRSNCSRASNSECSSEWSSVNSPVPSSSPAVLKCRSRTCRQRSSALSRSPFPAAAAIASSVSVTFDIALTTTYGCLARRPLTMPAMRSMAVASSTEVPPNFITITALPPLRMLESSQESRQIALHFEEFGIQQCRTGCAANRIVRQHGEFKVEHATRSQPPYAHCHPFAAIEIETRLRTVRGRVVHQRSLWRQRTSQRKRLRFEIPNGCEHRLDVRLLLQLHRHRLCVPVFHRDAIAVGCHAETSILHMVLVKLAEEFLRLLFHFLFFARDVWDHIAQNVQRGNARIAGPADCLHRGYKERLHAELLMQRRERDDQANSRAIGIGHDVSARLLAPALQLDQREMIRIDLWDHQRHILLHSESAGVA